MSVNEANKADVIGRMNPQMRAAYEKSTALSAAAGALDNPAPTLAAMRAGYRAERRYWNEGGPVMARTEETAVPTPHGPVTVRIHTPAASENQADDGGSAPSGGLSPAIVFAHGGGYVLGDLDTHDRICRALADASGAVVVGVDYALSPEAKCPVALEQSLAVVRWLAAHGAERGIDGRSLALAGDSAGAQLALAAMLRLRDRGDGDLVKALLLYYGLYGLKDSASQRLLGGAWDGLGAADIAFYRDAYCADPATPAGTTAATPDHPDVDLLGADLTHGIAPAYIAIADLDPLRDDSSALAAILTAHGSPNQVAVFNGVLHGFLHYSRMVDEAGRALAEGAAFARRYLTPPTPAPAGTTE